VSSIVQVIAFSFVPFIWWLITARKKHNFFKWIGLKKPIIKGSLIKFLLIILTVSGTYIVLMAIVMKWLLGDVDTALTQFEGQGWNALLYILIYAVIQTSLSEEVLFRGFIGKRLANKFGFVVGNTVQAILFGLLHGLPFGLVTDNIIVTVVLTIIPGAIGWIMGWLNEKYASGSIVPSWIMHAVMNILSALSLAL
jgi:membrane protease YdiL (CAAX protease family)